MHIYLYTRLYTYIIHFLILPPHHLNWECSQSAQASEGVLLQIALGVRQQGRSAFIFVVHIGIACWLGNPWNVSYFFGDLPM